MPDITREEAKAELRVHLARINDAIRDYVPEGNATADQRYLINLRRTAAFDRLALAALEDADTLHDMAQRADRHLRDCGVVQGDACDACAGFAAELADFYDTAIDRARGAEKRERPQVPPNIDL